LLVVQAASSVVCPRMNPLVVDLMLICHGWEVMASAEAEAEAVALAVIGNPETGFAPGWCILICLYLSNLKNT
jgi:hypothetical protein